MEPSRPEKILIAMYQIADGSTSPCRYEDIVVKVFQIFPKEFQLRGYPQFPDSSDIHKPLYGPLKSKGLVKSANKTFALTEKGIAIARGIIKHGSTHPFETPTHKRLSRDVENEVERLRKSAAFRFYCTGESNRILDTDFYSYLGVSVRTGKNDFEGRLHSVGGAVNAWAEIDPKPESNAMKQMHDALLIQFNQLIQKKTGR